MNVMRPRTWDEALDARAASPEALAIAGGTDVMVDVNAGRARPPAFLDLTAVPELREWGTDDGMLRIGAGVPYATLIDEVGPLFPALAMASRTVGSPQIRNRGTLGGNLGTASPAGDGLPPLLAAGATVEVASRRGVRHVPMAAFCTGPKRSALAPDELVAAVLVPAADGPQQFAKIGTRNAMVIAVCSFALVIDVGRRRVGTGIGSAGPTPLAAPDAERFLEGALQERGWERAGPLSGAALERFGELVAAAARPIDDVRSTAAYRRHALAVVARRCAGWALS